ncbi:MAG: PD-(D/E)XK nuclease family transposase [Bacilli bacterium]
MIYTAKNDRLFKTVASNKYGKEILEALLSTIFNEKVEVLEFIPVELALDTESERKKTLDVLVRVDNKIINVEMNAQGLSEIVKIRNLSYLCKMFSNNITKGEGIDVETKFLQINLIYNYKKAKRLMNKAYLKDEDGIYTENFGTWNVYMEKAEEICCNNEEERKRLRYLLMLNMTPEELKDFFPEDEIIKKFQGEIMRLNSDTKFIREISEEEEKNNAIKNLLKIKTPIKTIAIATNLTEEEVKERIKKFNLEG